MRSTSPEFISSYTSEVENSDNTKALLDFLEITRKTVMNLMESPDPEDTVNQKLLKDNIDNFVKLYSILPDYLK